MSKRCCFTGHRDVPEEDYVKLMLALLKKMEELIQEGYTVVNTGGALGFDTMAASAVLRLKKKYPHIKLHMYLPFPQQADRWKREDRNMYEYFKKQSEKIDFACESYTNYSMAKRNRALVDNADYCIAYCTKSTGGTVYTLNYAIGKGIDFINLASEIKK
ncbi:MAG: DUF1273 family protein [Oscillospiraceae bacterium]|nr:DUF1273 family protein [Oscillospiraceae bacterium]